MASLTLPSNAFPHLGDLGVVILIQPDETKPGVEGSSQLAILIFQKDPKPFVDASQKCIGQGAAVDETLGLQKEEISEICNKLTLI
ncbi:Hypothetical predicted protein [Octopus vulgaris]|uniref:Uncharacterized protein n=1 Tax=Octopus vulgaris TaxID=6645 RepID=A0AA36AKT8_OCTVU|nr:Hypothetical predicted protein [Octopus vulgaris]